MQPIHPEIQLLLAGERIERLMRSARSDGSRAGTRLRVGGWLVRAGLRLAPELEERGERYRARPALR